MSKRLFQIVFVSMCCILFVGCYGSKNSRYNQNNQNNQLAVENALLKQQVKQLEEDKIALEVQVKNLGQIWKL